MIIAENDQGLPVALPLVESRFEMKTFLWTAAIIAGAIAALAPAAGPDADQFANRIEKRVRELQPTRADQVQET